MNRRSFLGSMLGAAMLATAPMFSAKAKFVEALAPDRVPAAEYQDAYLAELGRNIADDFDRMVLESVMKELDD